MAATPKKTAVKNQAKKTETKNLDLQTLSVDELQKFVAEKRADITTYTQSHRAGELVNPRVLGATRKEIARALTALRVAQNKEEN